jgi:hypothetical protein
LIGFLWTDTQSTVYFCSWWLLFLPLGSAISKFYIALKPHMIYQFNIDKTFQSFFFVQLITLF